MLLIYLGRYPRRSLIVIVMTVLDEVCVRKRFFLIHEFILLLMLTREAGGNVRAARALVDEFVRIFADGTADGRQGRACVVVCDYGESR